MKGLNLQLLFTFFLASVVFAQNDSASQAGAESLIETQDRIKKALIEHAAFKEMNAIGYETYKVDAVSFNACTLTYRSVSRIDKKGLDFIGNYTVSLNDIELEKITVKKDFFHYNLLLQTHGRKKRVKLEHTTSMHGQTAGSTQELYKVAIGFEDEGIAKETAKALGSVIRKCQGQKQP